MQLQCWSVLIVLVENVHIQYHSFVSSSLCYLCRRLAKMTNIFYFLFSASNLLLIFLDEKLSVCMCESSAFNWVQVFWNWALFVFQMRTLSFTTQPLTLSLFLPLWGFFRPWFVSAFSWIILSFWQLSGLNAVPPHCKGRILPPMIKQGCLRPALPTVSELIPCIPIRAALFQVLVFGCGDCADRSISMSSSALSLPSTHNRYWQVQRR